MRWGLGLGGLAVLALAGALAWQSLWAPPAGPAGAPARPAPAATPAPVSPTPSSTPGAVAGGSGAAPVAPSSSTPPVGAAAPTPREAATPPSADSGPRFDVARVAPGGGTVVAGRAAPGAEVSLQDQGRELGRARADSRGEFVITPDAPLPAGTHELTLHTRDGQGREQRGDESVVMVVPEAPAAGQAAPSSSGAPMAVLIPPSGTAAPPRVLQGAPRAGGRLSLDVVDYDETGAIRFAGTAPAGQTLRLYIDQAHSGDAASSAEGRWTYSPATAPAPGRHTLRVDQLNPQGQVVARVEVPFLREAAAIAPATAGTAGSPAPDRVVVQPGHNLWRIARQTYGRGIRYTEIHRANVDQIRDPARIYPGQIFTLPAP